MAEGLSLIVSTTSSEASCEHNSKTASELEMCLQTNFVLGGWGMEAYSEIYVYSIGPYWKVGLEILSGRR